MHFCIRKRPPSLPFTDQRTRSRRPTKEFSSGRPSTRGGGYFKTRQNTHMKKKEQQLFSKEPVIHTTTHDDNKTATTQPKLILRKHRVCGDRELEEEEEEGRHFPDRFVCLVRLKTTCTACVNRPPKSYPMAGISSSFLRVCSFSKQKNFHQVAEKRKVL